MDGRRWSDGLHQAVEAKEGVTIEAENQTLASITFQNYFRMYPKLSGMTGTALTEAPEFFDIYRMNVVSIPTNVPVQRIDEDDEFYNNTDNSPHRNEIRARQEKGEPSCGTSHRKSEMLSNSATRRHQAPRAECPLHESEAILSQAGRMARSPSPPTWRARTDTSSRQPRFRMWTSSRTLCRHAGIRNRRNDSREIAVEKQRC